MSHFLARAFSVLADGLPHRRILRDPLTEAAAADDLLLCRRRVLQAYAGFTVQLPAGALEHDAEVLADKRGVGMGQIKRGIDTQQAEFFGYTPADAPDFFCKLEAQQLACPGKVARRQGQNAPELRPLPRGPLD